jgi:hypothetical protein
MSRYVFFLLDRAARSNRTSPRRISCSSFSLRSSDTDSKFLMLSFWFSLNLSGDYVLICDFYILEVDFERFEYGNKITEFCSEVVLLS